MPPPGFLVLVFVNIPFDSDRSDSHAGEWMAVTAQTTHTSPARGPVDIPGRIVLFGFEPQAVTLHLLPRSRRWRLLGAGRTVGVALVLAPVAGLVPPHVPWALGVLGVGGFLGRRRFQERFTVVGIQGTCPKCGVALEADRTRLRFPHPIPCETCHHEGSVEVDPEALEALAEDE